MSFNVNLIAALALGVFLGALVCGHVAADAPCC